MKKQTAPKGDTRLKMVQTAFDLFYKQGVNATSVDEILEKSETGKSQFYYYFKSKEGIVQAVLAYFYDLLKNNKLPGKHTFDSWEDLENWFRFFITVQKGINCERSCPIATIGNDLTNDQDLLRQDIRLIYRFSRQALSKFFAGVKVKGEISSSIDPEALADFCFIVVQGGLLISKVERKLGSFENAVEHALSYLKSLKTFKK